MKRQKARMQTTINAESTVEVLKVNELVGRRWWWGGGGV